MNMSVVAEAEKLIFSLSEEERNELVGRILRSLPLYARDGGLAEARRRDREMDENPESVMTMEELDEKLVKSFPFLRR